MRSIKFVFNAEHVVKITNLFRYDRSKSIDSFQFNSIEKLAYLFWREPRCAGAEDRHAVKLPSNALNRFP